jgi:hypothetical protein
MVNASGFMSKQLATLAAFAAVFFVSLVSDSLADEIGGKGGEIELKSRSLGEVCLQIPPGAFVSKTQVKMSVTQSKETAEDFESTQLTRSGRLKRISGELRIQSGSSKPKTHVTVQIRLPEPPALPKGSLKVLAQFFYESDTELHDSFQEVESKFDLSNRSLKFELEPRYFTASRGRDGKVEAVVVVVADSEK